MRRAAIAAGVAVGVLTVGMLAGPARAQTAGDWSGSHWGQTSWSTADAQPVTLYGTLQRQPWAPVTLELGLDGQSVPDSSCARATWATPSEDRSSPSPFVAILNFSFVMQNLECNGYYTMHVHGVVTAGGNVTDRYDLGPTVLTVQRPAPPVSGVTAKANSDRSVAVTWDSINGAATTTKDLTGFVVTRSDDAGHASASIISDPSATSYTDKTVPASGGTFTYSVQATRYVSGAGPATDAKPVTIAKVPASTTSTTAPISGPTTTAPGTGAGGAPGPTDPTTGGGGGGVQPSGGVRTPTPPPVQATDPDEGFETNLPYEAEPGAVAARLPSGGEGGDLAGAGVLIPFAVAVVLAMWAVLFRYVTKSARDTEAALALLQVELE